MELPAAAQITEADLSEWYKLQNDLAKLKARESQMRKVLFSHFFPKAEEGVNTYDLPEVNGVPYELKGTRKIDRKVDEAVLKKMTEVSKTDAGEVPSEFDQLGVSADKLVRWKPELNVGEYRKLSDNVRAVVDKMLIIKDGSPSMEIKPKSDRARAKAMGAS